VVPGCQGTAPTDPERFAQHALTVRRSQILLKRCRSAMIRCSSQLLFVALRLR
jgi:hypothetical protein